MKRFCFLLFFSLLPALAYASLADEMNRFWNNLGGSSNVNSAYAGQSVGYYTGGSMNIRSPVMQQKPFSMQTPRITTGCGGIDMFTGSFSHINSDQFIAQLKSIGANSMGYAFQLALQTLSPMIKSVTDKVQEVADMMNGFNINSCESAKLLVDGIAGKNITLAEANCAQMALISGSASDAASAKSSCRSSSTQTNEISKLNEEERPVDINFVWQTMKKEGYIETLGAETSEAFMSIVGTVIVKQDRGGISTISIKPFALDSEKTEILLNGGKIRIYKCVDRNLCLNMEEKEINLDSNTAFKPKIARMLENIQNKIISINNNQALSDNELALIGKTSIPVLRILVNSVTGKSPIGIDAISDLVARDTLNKFLQAISSTMRTQIEQLKLLNSNKDILDILAKNTEFIVKFLEKENIRIRSDLQQTLNIIETNEKFDRQLASVFSGHIKSVLDFSNSIKTGVR